jgi:hypothetical protein
MGAQPPPTASADPGASAAPTADAAQTPYGPQQNARDQFFAQNPDAAKAYTPARPVGVMSSLSPVGKGLAAAFAGLAEYGGQRNRNPGQGQHIADKWLQQSLAQRQYDANAPQREAEAKNKAYGTELQNKASEAITQHTQAETGLIGQNLPMQEAAEKEYNDLVGHWQSKDVPNFDAYANAKLQAMPSPIARRIQPLLQNIKQLPQTGKGYSLTMQDDLPKSVNVYGKEYDRNDPELQKLPAGAAAAADFDRAMQAHSTKLTEQEAKDTRVAGHAADRQAAGFTQAASMQQNTFNQQQIMAKQKEVQPRYDTALDADQRLGRMESSYTKGVKGDQQAQLALLTDHIGMTMGLQKGARITKDIIQEAQQSQPWLAKMGAKFDSRGVLSGVTLGPEQMKQMLDLGYEARDRSWNGAFDASRMQGIEPPKGAQEIYGKRTPGDKPAFGQTSANNGHVIQVGNKKYAYKGTGDTADLKNYTETK